LSVPIPTEATTQSDGRGWAILVNTDDILVLLRIMDLSVATVGKITLHIYDKKTKAWHTEDFDGELSSFRGFGSWIAVNQEEANYRVINGVGQPNSVLKESPGKSERQQILNPQDNYRDQEPIDSIFENYYPGIISLYDVRSGRKYRLDTGQGDTEVLLVDDKTIYYRVNDTLFRAEIGQTAIQNQMQIARDGNIQFAHWAFFSSK
jgi:hypothetical protein